MGMACPEGSDADRPISTDVDHEKITRDTSVIYE